MTGNRYVVMANGKGMRWGGHLGIPKHLITFDGETLLRRIVRQVRAADPNAEVIVSASDPRYETEGARRHRPHRDSLEIDRFVPELVTEHVCFLYGDTFYSDRAIELITASNEPGVRFFGDDRSIVAVQSRDREEFLTHLASVRELFLSGEIDSCIGWQLYHSIAGIPLEGKAIERDFERVDGLTAGFNSPADLADFIERYEATTEAAIRAAPVSPVEKNQAEVSVQQC